eukprot:Sdes_comp11182_c0_seq1m2717
MSEIAFKDGTERKQRRQVANANEQRRIQRINSGFELLKDLVPSLSGEKLSKAAVLQEAAEYIKLLKAKNTILRKEANELRKSSLVDNASSEPQLDISKRRRKISHRQDAHDFEYEIPVAERLCRLVETKPEFAAEKR